MELTEINKIIADLESEITQLQIDMGKPSTIVCGHIICEACQKAIEQEAIDKSWRVLQLNEKNSLLEKVRQYGIN